MSLNDPQLFNIVDPFPEKELEQIHPYYDRALAAYARHKKKLTEGHQKISGAIFMIDALEYHFRRYNGIVEKILFIDPAETNTEIIDKYFDSENNQLKRELKHEILAYLNRLYQFTKFAESNFINRSIPKRIKKIMVLRNIYSAKRGLDLNNKAYERDKHRLLVLESVMSGGNLWVGQDMILQYQDEKGKILEFNLAKDHGKIVQYTYDVILSKLQEES